MQKYEYLEDSDFLIEMDNLHLKEKYSKVTLLNWDETTDREITGIVTGGSINIDGTSSVRRTANLSIFISNTEKNIEHLDSDFSLNKKVSIEIGIKNITKKYKNYPIIWYPIGLFVITQMSLSRGTGGVTMSLNLKDKMCLLNGDVGGTLPASVTFSEMEYLDENDNIIIEQPTLFQIIQEAVNHWGSEQLGKL